MTAISDALGTPITPPPEFPVTWVSPEDANFHWTRDREHLPQPITPMFSSVAELTASQGYQRALPVYEESVVRRYDLVINTYNYTRLVAFSGTAEDLEARIRRHRQKVSAVCFRLKEIWEDEWRPELESHWDFWVSFDLESASLPELAAHLEETLVRVTRMYEIHFLMGAPMWFAIDEFEQFYCDLFPAATPLDAQRLLQGFDNKTLEIGRNLWQLSRLAKACPPVQKALSELPVEQVLPGLQSVAQARGFLAELRTFLETYGRRSDLWDWGYPSWQDDPTPVLNHLKNYLALPDRDLQAELVLAAAERQAAIAQARRALDGYPGPVVERFEALLRAAQVALVLTEDHTYYLDFNGFGWIHRVIGEFGGRFTAQGRLNHAGDIFYLRLEELQAMIADPTLNWRDLATTRRSEVERWSGYAEPRELGARPAQPVYIYSPESRRMMHYIGGFQAEAPPTPEPGLLRGQAGSSGKAIGPARLILSLADAHRLQPGDILVTTTTAPPWTPLFLTAAGLVTDAGGLLSHGAVVAREYRIPAVVGTHFATTTIRDGQMVEVDGDNGRVYLLSD